MSTNSSSVNWALVARMCAVALAVVLAGAVPVASAADPKASQYYEDALTRFEKKDYAGSIIQLKNSLKIDNRQLPVQVLLGKALLANSDVLAAEVAFNEALRLGVNRAEVVVPLSKAVLAQGKRQPLLDDPRFAPAGLPPVIRQQMLIQVAAAQADLGRPREALRAIEDARAIDPTSPDTWLAEVPIRIRARQFVEAVAAADKALTLSPRSADAVYLRGSVSHTRGDLPQAMATYTQALELDPAHLESLLARAGIALDRNRNADAKRDLAEARRVQPKEPRAIYMGAVLADREGDSKASRAALAEITNLIDPVPIEFMRYQQQVLILGGLAHHGLGQREKAKPYLEAVQRESPGSPVSKLLAQIHLADNNVDRAIESLDGYLRSFPTDAQALSLLASAHMSQGRHARAAQIMRDALKVQDRPELRSILGLSLIRGGKNHDATSELEVAYAKDPTQVQAGAALVALYLNDRKFKKATEVAEALVRRMPSQPGFHNLLGMARAKAGDGTKARAAFEQAARLDPSFVDPQLNLARLDISARQYEAAVARFNAILKANDKHIETLVEAGQFAALRGQGDEATRLLSRAADLSTAPGDLHAPFALFEHHLRAGRVGAAQEAARRLMSKAPDNVMVIVANARAALAAKTPDAARPLLVNAARLSNFDAPLLTKVALLQMGAGDTKAAAYSLSKALQGDPNHLPALALLTDAEIQLGEIPSAEKRARDIAAHHPKLGVGHALLGDIAAARGQWPAAIAGYRKAHQVEPTSSSALRLQRTLATRDLRGAAEVAEQWLKTHPNDIAVRRLQADNLVLAGNMPAARAAFEHLLKVSPNNADALNNYAHVLLALNDTIGAGKAAAAALAAKPDAPNIIGTAGWVAFKSGQTDRALQLLRDARLRDPTNADTRYFLAAALARAGRNGEAREELESALQGDAKFANAREAGELLRALK
ncbi:MAG: PEP-CTERM system TPR-repeat protein PrsT [Rubrivivax sp.]|nr:PEP-CTERM system TPR-repeat protein PrsT [Rubrivivax sp.]